MTMSLHFALEIHLQNNHAVVIAFQRPTGYQKKKNLIHEQSCFGASLTAYKIQY